MQGWSVKDIPDQSGKVALITGANRGLGYETALALAGAGAQVVLACRDANKAQAAADRIVRQHPRARLDLLAFDAGDLASVRSAAAQLQGRPLDLLIHNAAAILQPQGVTRDGFELHLGTNHLAPFALTGLLLPQLRPGARIVNMSSLAHRLTQGLDVDDLPLQRRPYKDMDAYGRSKLAALLFTFELDRRLRARGWPQLCVAAHPGYTATNLDLGNFFMRLSTRLFAQKPERGALPALRAATDPQAQGGDFFGPGGYQQLGGAPRKVDCSPQARDAALAARLWQQSEALTGVHYLSD